MKEGLSIFIFIVILKLELEFNDKKLKLVNFLTIILKN